MGLLRISYYCYCYCQNSFYCHTRCIFSKDVVDGRIGDDFKRMCLLIYKYDFEYDYFLCCRVIQFAIYCIMFPYLY
jgi:hypothetical protein